MEFTRQEVEVWYVLPALRRELAKVFLAKGLPQKDVAEILGVSEPAVSQYLKSKRAKELIFDPVTKEEIKKSAERILSQSSSPMQEIENLCTNFRERKCLCKIHKKFAALSQNCKICLAKLK